MESDHLHVTELRPDGEKSVVYGLLIRAPTKNTRALAGGAYGRLVKQPRKHEMTGSCFVFSSFRGQDPRHKFLGSAASIARRRSSAAAARPPTVPRSPSRRRA